MDRAARTNSAERLKRQACNSCGGPSIRAYGVRTKCGGTPTTPKARVRSRVVDLGGWGAHAPSPEPGRKGPPPFGPEIYTPQIQKRTGGQSPVYNYQKKFVCNTKERAEFFGPVHGVRRLAPRRAAHAWKASDREQIARPGTVCGRDIVERMGAGAPVASGRVRLGRKTGDVLPRSGRTGGRGPTFKKKSCRDY